MNVTELRIGNWVFDRSKGFADRTIGERQVSHELIYSMACGNEKDIIGIPLTEEWLVKLGFEKCDSGFKEHWSNDDFEIEQHGVKFPLRVSGGESAPHLTQYFAHQTTCVHQLQNLYNAVTGKELSISPTRFP